ncbi:MAG: hypothetical protein V1820_03780 [archaeon]
MELFGRKITKGFTMALVGFAMILYSAGNYLFRTGNQSPAIGTIGLVSVAVGMAIEKRETPGEKKKSGKRKKA